jgi:hypothetical protein
VTPEKHYVYDAATVNGSAMTSAKGRLAEAYTGPATGKITDLGFSYTGRGQVSGVWQWSTHSGGYYKTTASYWANGLRNTLQLATPSCNTWTYAADGEGRLNERGDRGQRAEPGVRDDVQHVQPADGSDVRVSRCRALSYDASLGRMSPICFRVACNP